jgi:hypothetical protein
MELVISCVALKSIIKLHIVLTFYLKVTTEIADDPHPPLHELFQVQEQNVE